MHVMTYTACITQLVHYTFRSSTIDEQLNCIWRGFNEYTAETTKDLLGLKHLAYVLSNLICKHTHGFSFISHV